MSPGTHPERGCVLRGSVPLLGLRSPQSSLRSLRTLPGIGSEEKGMNKRVSLAPRGAGGPGPPDVRSAVQSGGRVQLLPRGRQCGARNPERRGALAPGAATLPAAWGCPRGHARPARSVTAAPAPGRTERSRRRCPSSTESPWSAVV